MLMRAMHDVPDLDLLRMFEHLHRERHLTRAARRAGLSQPAMSRALGRLRAVFGDPLFVRSATGMVPTPRAEALMPRIQGLLDEARALLHAENFVPSAIERAFVVGTTDYIEAELLPRLVPRVAEQAPRVTITSRSVADGADAIGAQLDLVIAPLYALPSEFRSMHMFDDELVCAVRADHPRVRGTLALSRYLELAHVLIAPRGRPGGPVEQALAALGKTRHVAVYTQSFLSAPLLVSRTDLVLTAPARVLGPLAAPFGLRLLTPPLELRSFPVHQAWHPRFDHDPAHAWFRALVAEAARAPVDGGVKLSRARRGLPSEPPRKGA